MAIRKFKCGHSRTVQPYKHTAVHEINGDCPACSAQKYKLVNVGKRSEKSDKGKVLVLRKK